METVKQDIEWAKANEDEQQLQELHKKERILLKNEIQNLQ